MPSARLIIAVTGPDGAGKSTICEALQPALTRHGAVRRVSVWDAFKAQRVISGKDELERYLRQLDALARAFFLLHAWAQSLHMALADGAEVLLLDAYWYKYACLELAHGAPAAPILAAAAGLVRPDLTLFLDVSPESALARKGGAVSAYEDGLGAGGFLNFQAKARGAWRAVEDAAGGFLHLPAGLGAAATAEAALEHVQRALLPRKTRVAGPAAETL